jgi:hypothetical protein
MPSCQGAYAELFDHVKSIGGHLELGWRGRARGLELQLRPIGTPGPTARIEVGAVEQLDDAAAGVLHRLTDQRER